MLPFPAECPKHTGEDLGRGNIQPHAAGLSLPLPWGAEAAFFVGATLMGGRADAFS